MPDIQPTMFGPPSMAWPRELLISHGWVEQDIPGLWRHAWKANGLELGTTAALRANADAVHETHAWHSE